MEPFKVTFRFAAPVAADSEYPLHLDALVAWAVAQEAEQCGSTAPWADADDLCAVFAKAESEGGWVWQASRVVFRPASARMLTNQLRKCDPNAFFEDYNKGIYRPPRAVNEATFAINPNSGQYRAYQFFVASQWMERAEAWAVGDMEVAEHYLRMVSSLGKLARNGFGRVVSVEVQRDLAAEQLWKLRTLPTGADGVEGVEYVPALQCLRAPYWRKTDRVMALEPVA